MDRGSGRNAGSDSVSNTDGQPEVNSNASRCSQPAKSVRATHKPPKSWQHDQDGHRLALTRRIGHRFGILRDSDHRSGQPGSPAASEAALVRYRCASRSSKQDRGAQRLPREMRHPGATGMKTGRLSSLSDRLPQGIRMAAGECDPPRKRGARQAERCPAQNAVRPLKGKIPWMPSRWNKLDRWDRQGAERACGQPTNPGRAEQPESRRNAVRSRTSEGRTKSRDGTCDG